MQKQVISKGGDEGKNLRQHMRRGERSKLGKEERNKGGIDGLKEGESATGSFSASY